MQNFYKDNITTPSYVIFTRINIIKKRKMSECQTFEFFKVDFSSVYTSILETIWFDSTVLLTCRILTH